MKYADLQNKDIKELQQTLKDLQVKLGKMRFEMTTNSLKNYSELGVTKRDIARILTAINSVKSK